MWGIPAVLCFQARGDHSLHAGAVEIDGRAIVFAAPGRSGKTTLVTALHAAGHRLLAEDSTCLRLDATPEILPGPAMLRVRRDSFDALHIPDVTVVAEDPDRVHLSIDQARRGTSDPLPLAGVVLLRVDGALRIERLGAAEAIPELWTLSLGLPTARDRERRFGQVASLAATVPTWNLYRPLRYDLIDEVIDLVVATCLP